jgi:hypothetical protein
VISFNLHWSIGQALVDVALGYLVFFVFVFLWKLGRKWCWYRERVRGDREALVLLRKEQAARDCARWKREENRSKRGKRRGPF